MTVPPSAGLCARDAALDLQYNARAAVPDSNRWIAHYAQLAERVHSWPGFRQAPAYAVAYGDGPDDLLDIFPAPEEGSPVFVFIHGGYWRALSRKDGIFMAPLFHLAGVTVVSLDYSLAPAVSLPQIHRQVVSAMNWVSVNIRRYNGDPSRIHVSGHSAGAQLAAMLLLPPDSLGGDGVAGRFRPPQSASLFSGLFDLRPLMQTHINDWLRMDEHTAHAMSPLLHRPRPGCPVVAVCGAAETDAFRWQSRALAEAWSDMPGVPPVAHLELPGSHHFDCPLSLADARSPATRAVFSLMGLNDGGDDAVAMTGLNDGGDDALATPDLTDGGDNALATDAPTGNGAEGHGRPSP